MLLGRMKMFFFTLILLTIALVGNIFAQNEKSGEKKVNFPYSKNPKTTSTKNEKTTNQIDKNSENKKESEGTSENNKKFDEDKTNSESVTGNKDPNAQGNKASKAETKDISAKDLVKEENNSSDEDVKKEIEVELAKSSPNVLSNDNTNDSVQFESRSIANKTFEVAERESKKAILPTEIYKIGVGDILFISLQNAPPNVSTYFTVLNNGAIDYPLAGGMNFVLGLTTDEIETQLRKKIKLYENPQISVKVREHSSHSITVLGLVEKPGIKYLQREAVPLFIIRAEAIVQPRANHVAIRRAENDETEQFSLIDSKNDDVLIFPGDIVEFSSILPTKEDAKVPQFYYIGGNVNSVGQKDFYPGITLTQAILASGGLTKSKVKIVVIRRKNEKGLLVPFVFNLNSIKNGKVPDPVLQAGDTIEVEN